MDVPGGDAWTISLAQFTDAEIQYMENPTWGERTCTTELSAQNAGADASPVGSLTHPSGATGTFTLGIRTHGRTNVPLFCENVTLAGAPNDPTDDVAHVPASYDSWSVLSKQITGSGLPTAQWNYTYASPREYNNPNAGPFGTPYVCPSGSTLEQCAAKPTCTATSGCGLKATTLVAGPESRWTRYTYGTEYRTNEGQLLKVENGYGTGPSTTIVAGRPQNVLRDVVNTYETTTNGTCPIQWGDNLQFGIDYAECVAPKTKSVTWQQGVDFIWEEKARNAYAMSTRVQRFSRNAVTLATRDSRTDETTYLYDVPKWVVGLVTHERNEDLNYYTARTDYDPDTRLPVASYWPYPAGTTAVPQQTMAYAAKGVLQTVRDGLDNAVTLSNWYRGVPRQVTYPDAKTQSAVVNNRGQISQVTDQNGFATNYSYDARGLLATITHPTGDSVAWNVTNLGFAKTTAIEYGFPVGTWKRTVYTGAGYKVTWFDALWRPRMTWDYDAGNATETQRFNAWIYDAAGRTQFVAYPRASATSMASFTDGVETGHDALDRAIWVSQDSEHGLLTTTTDYLVDFVTRTTNPLQKATSTRYQAFDDPTSAVPTLIDAPTGQRTQIHRSVLGMALWMQRRGTQGQAEVATRYYVYDHALRLCKQTEPETGATVVDYDGAGNVIWSAAGLSLATPNPTPATHGSTCASQRPTAYASGRRVSRTYDSLNRLKTLVFPDNTGNQTWTYTPDGLPETIVTSNNGLGEQVHNGYSYNRRRLLSAETSAQPGAYSWSVGYGYNANGHLSTLTYPSLMSVSYAPNALGQPTRAGGFATGVKYYPNGAISEFYYGNGLRHQMFQNARQLPARSTDTGVLDLDYNFDANGNVSSTIDRLNSHRSRWMQYDDLDRLTAAGSVSFGGDHWHRFTYDVLDNLKSWKLGPATAGGTPAKDYANYEYDAANRLTRILGSGGEVRQQFTYDVQGNLKTKSTAPPGTTWAFDFGNRNRGIVGKEGMRYDGHGRRVSTWLPQEAKARFYMYAQSGQLLFEASETQGKNIEHVHLGGSLVASSEQLASGGSQVRYKHTDALGSPVVTTDQAGNEVLNSRQIYEPFGKPISGPIDGIGYTGHVMDPQSELVYMQQRYYDPDAGRFLSIDPVTADNVTGWNFNRYNYGAGNPYRFTDPDGRIVRDNFHQPWSDPHRKRSYLDDVQLGGPKKRYANGKNKDKGTAGPKEHVLSDAGNLDGTLGLDEDGDGFRHCAELLKVAFRDQGITQTPNWIEGRKIGPKSDVKIGTAIATFVDGKYPQKGMRHAAIYLGQDAGGIFILEQYDSPGNPSGDDPSGKPHIQTRYLRWNVGPDAGISNDGSAFSTVMW